MENYVDCTSEVFLEGLGMSIDSVDFSGRWRSFYYPERAP